MITRGVTSMGTECVTGTSSSIPGNNLPFIFTQIHTAFSQDQPQRNHIKNRLTVRFVTPPKTLTAADTTVIIRNRRGCGAIPLRGRLLLC